MPHTATCLWQAGRAAQARFAFSAAASKSAGRRVAMHRARNDACVQWWGGQRDTAARLPPRLAQAAPGRLSPSATHCTAPHCTPVTWRWMSSSASAPSGAELARASAAMASASSSGASGLGEEGEGGACTDG